MPKLIPPELNPIDDANPADNESEPLANTEPRRSARISVPSAKAAEASGINKLSAVQRAVMESKESGDRVRAERKERREAKKAQMIEEPEQEEPETPETMELDEADMAMLAEIVALLQDNPIRVEGPDEPANLREVMESQHAKEWQAAYNDEFKSIKDMEVYELIPRSEVPKGRRVMWGRSTFIVKYDEDGNPARFKVRYVCKGYEAAVTPQKPHDSKIKCGNGLPYPTSESPNSVWG
ncbi:hypothetical protein BOTBODRAFT_49620 [Botryobasidium botryosum FD-172 SS1]|uniref:Reverse transcriptase Ty1/copia-type domain-containing protein n=1 Tax=Botryobasidium botryosum (strain FD-172 SS1) TaxID=930990 RepID=A0A067M317_BOTB1|nr:hypothetical protein BOTBODRAFT_49620 [Botryobasidium botryosum FD-172 SS1]